MNGLLLIFIGSVLIINGISIIKGYDNKETGIFNGIIGFFCLIGNIVLMVNAKENTAYLAIAQSMLFTFTYIFLSFIKIYSLSGKLFGWYCLFVFFNALFYAYYTSADARMIGLWLLWAILWFLFFCVFSLNKTIKYLGELTLVIGIVTCTLPGLMMVTNTW
ncbi:MULTISPECIES: AmiS/UreI family transporter [Providencia]|uniref:AmiS/UreI family transporter n=1 Tax=Providencia TaxID=586 RepID=UPI00234A4E7B|nr:MULTISPECIES: AmiS/UreI family transporter [Providencia]WRV50675.1 AmiS/UreI family transporter [Providencia stuartii]